METILVVVALIVGFGAGLKFGKYKGEKIFCRLMDVFSEELGREKVMDIMDKDMERFMQEQDNNNKN